MSNITNFVQVKLQRPMKNYSDFWTHGEEMHTMLFNVRKTMSRAEFREFVRTNLDMSFEELGRCIAVLSPWIELRKELHK